MLNEFPWRDNSHPQAFHQYTSRNLDCSTSHPLSFTVSVLFDCIFSPDFLVNYNCNFFRPVLRFSLDRSASVIL